MFLQLSDGPASASRIGLPIVVDPPPPDPGPFSSIFSRSTVVYNPQPAESYTLPTTFLDSRYNPGGIPLVWASDILLSDSGNSVTNGVNLQAAIDAAAARIGHSRIRLPSGWRSVTIRIRKHTAGAYWTYIEWDNKDSASTAEGYRAVKANLTNAPKLLSDGTGAGCVWSDLYGDYTRFTGVEFVSVDYPSVGANSRLNYRLVYISGSVGSDETVQNTEAKAPNWIGIDRCWVNGQNLGRHINGMVINGQNCFVVDSIVDGVWAYGFESHGIVCFNSPGKLKIVGNEIEGGSINFFIGGVVPDIPLLQTYDVEFRRNWVHKRASWNPNDPTYDHFIDPISITAENPSGVEASRTVKNLYEMKWGNRALIEGNIFDSNWSSSQQGAAICFKTENSVDPADPGGKTDAVLKNVVFRHNIVRNSSGAIEFIGHGFGGSIAENTNRIEVVNNLFYEIANDLYAHVSDFGVSPCGILVSEGFHDLYVRHNTFALTKGTKTRWGRPQLHIWDGNLQTNLTFKDNIVYLQAPNGGQSIYPANISPAPIEGTATLQQFTGGAYTYSKNVFPNAQQNGNPYPAASFYPANLAAIGFVDFANDNLRLSGASTYHNAASDGTDIGCNQTTVELATQNVVTGT